MQLDTLREGDEKNIVQVIMQLFPFLISPVIDFFEII